MRGKQLCGFKRVCHFARGDKSPEDYQDAKDRHYVTRDLAARFLFRKKYISPVSVVYQQYGLRHCEARGMQNRKER